MQSHASAPAAIDAGLVRAHGLAALATLLVSVLFGIVVSLQFLYPDLGSGSLTFGWGRLRYAHTQGIMLGWLGNAFLAFLYHAVPVLTGRRVTSTALGWVLWGLWNCVAIVPGWILVLMGISQPLEWAEFPLIIDACILLALLLAALQFLPVFFREGLDSLYVSGWYILGGLVFTLLAYPMGNLVPEFVSGATSAAFGGLWIHDAVGLFVTPLALAILYYVIPAASGRPIFSHFLSMLGFWGLFFFYPLNGTHHYVFSVIPMAAQLGAIAASTLLGVVVVLVVTNLLLSLRGAGWLPRDPGLRFVALAVVFYFIVSMQGAAQAQMALNRVVHFSDWVIGHSHLAMLGFASFAAIGGLIHAWQRLPGVHCHARALDWSFWLLTCGIGVMVIDLTVAGLVQGRLWQEAVPWMDAVRASRPYWLLRSLSAIPITAGFVLLGVGLCGGRISTTASASAGTTPASAAAASAVPPTAADTATHAAPGAALHTPSRRLGFAYVVTGIAGIGFFALSMLVLGLWPGQEIDAQIAASTPPGVMRLSAAEARGRAIYAREGCAYCHTQQVRFLDDDIRRYGAPTQAWETQFDSPHLWGTRRIGPDLARSHGTRSQDWHYAHLFAPRSVVPDSIMPSYAALFDGSPLTPTQEARDLVAYIETLGRARSLAWPEGEAATLTLHQGEHMDHLTQSATELNAHPAATRRDGAAPDFSDVPASTQGPALWLRNCAGCHGVDGRGDGPAAAWLSPRPANLAEHSYAHDYVLAVLWRGVAGTSMPAWRDHSAADLLALADVVAALAGDGTDGSDDAAAVDAATLAEGRRVYERHCTQCHGADGRGDGFAAASFGVAPVDFTLQRASTALALRVLENGIPGSPMAPWTDRLDAAQRRAVTAYVRSLFQPQNTLQEARNVD